MHQTIAPIIIVCGQRYAKTATIAVKSFLKHHHEQLFVAADNFAKNILSVFNNKNLCIVDINKYTKSAIEKTGNKQFTTFEYDSDGNHDRTYSALKVIIMDEIIQEKCPGAKYTLSLDADTIFTGDILTRTKQHLNITRHRFDIYMIQRDDPRMLLVCDLQPGSGYTLWKCDSNFIKKIISNFNDSCTGLAGGSQMLINSIKISCAYHEINDPMLHFVSPDLKNPNITDKEILKLQPAYIHLHGANSYARLLKFERIFNDFDNNI